MCMRQLCGTQLECQRNYIAMESERLFEKGIKMTEENAAQMEMPKYKCHKEVHALEIAYVEPLIGGVAMIHPVDSRYAPFKVDADYIKKHNPQDGGYYVVYEGGYASWSPKEAFENGYNTCE